MVDRNDYTVEALTHWPGLLTEPRVRSRFGVTWTQTLNLLCREIDKLDGANVVMRMAVSSRDIRRDGALRANADPEHPGVIIAFDSRFGSLYYPCDTFTDWKDNVRAIALALEALRKVDRYGVTKRGEQYSGFNKQIPPAGGTSATMDVRTAAEIIASVDSPSDFRPERVLHIERVYREARRVALASTHPDRHGGDTKRFQVIQRATDVLDRHYGAKR